MESIPTEKNTTYTFNFGNAIADNNEGNALENFQYVFSTGPVLDSLSIEGSVENSFDLKTDKNIFVMLYRNTIDSVPFKKRPLYFAKTDEKGSFSIRNISPGRYKLFALKETNNNYLYDKIGNLKTDVAEGIDTIRWTVYGKINRIVKSSGATTIDYAYDPGGNRTSKKVIISGDTTKTFYVRDAQGNVLAVYVKKNSAAITWEEQHLYGSSRLGMWRWDTIVSTAPPIVQGSTPVYELAFW